MLNTPDPFVMLAGTLLIVTLLTFSIGFLINWYRNRTVMVSYKRIGFLAAVIVAIYELISLALIASTSFSLGMSAISIVLTVGWLMLRIWAFTNSGIFYSNKLGLRSFPLVAPRLGLLPAPTAETASDPIASQIVEQPAPETDTPIGLESAPPQPIEPASAPGEPIAAEAAPTAPAIHWRNYWLTTLGVGVGALVYSAILFALTLPGVGVIFRDVLSSGANVTPLSLVLVLELAFTEEIFFRLGIQNYLAAKLANRRRGYEIAILVTAVLWTLGHAGALDPDWVKLAQVFPIGLALGWLYRRYGTESAIIAHSLFNLLGGLLLSPLFLR